MFMRATLCGANVSLRNAPGATLKKRMEMISHNTTLTPCRDAVAIKYLAITLALAALAIAGSPANAATRHHHHVTAHTINGLHMYAGEALGQHDQVLGEMPMNESRA